MFQYDEKALAILQQAQDDIRDEIEDSEPGLSEAEIHGKIAEQLGSGYDYARNNGYLFPPRRMSHKELVDGLRVELDRANPMAARDALVASLSRNRPDLRGALGTLMKYRTMPPHPYKAAVTDDGPICAVCGFAHPDAGEVFDMTFFAYMRMIYGSSEDSFHQLIGGWFDLWHFNEFEPVRPDPEDFDRLDSLLRYLDSQGNEVRGWELFDGIKACTFAEDDALEPLLDTLAWCGILSPKGKPNFDKAFVPAIDRKKPDGAEAQMYNYPINHWFGRDGVNWDAARRVFPELD